MGNAILADVRCETCRYCQVKFGVSKCFVGDKMYGTTIPTSHWCAKFLPQQKDEYKILQR